MPVLTADTITDEQIRELRAATDARLNPMLVATCNNALTLGRFGRAARARCAEILNAKETK